MAHTARAISRYTEADRARDLARRVNRLAVGGRTDPEVIVIEKLTIARELQRMAQRLEGIA